jgi:hypothetical protein
MIALADLETRFNDFPKDAEPLEAVTELLAMGESVLEHWLIARGETPTEKEREGFRLLALHRQGAKGDPSFNACRETCRELVYHYNLVKLEPDHAEIERRLTLTLMIAKHLYLFVSGKMAEAGLGDFCCSSRPLHAQTG